MADDGKPVTETGAEDWAGEMGERWLQHIDRFEGMIAPIGRALIDHAEFRADERVVDIGCGGGATSLEIARRVGPRGGVLGIDISPHLVGAATRRASAAGAGNVRFECADAATVSIDEPPFDRLFSRFGVMFFPDAPAAFANLRRLVKPDGRADMSVWAPARENAWISQMMSIIAEFVELPAPVPRSPGPFALDDPAYVRELLERAGFSTVHIRTWRGEQLVGGPGATPEGVVSFVFDAMSFGRLLAEAGQDARSRVNAQLTELFTRHHGPEGVRMSGTAFLVTAKG